MAVKNVGTIRLETEENIQTNTNNDISGDDVQQAIVDTLDSLSKAEWQSGLSYEAGEIKIFSRSGSKGLYLCLAGTVPGESPITASSKWEQVRGHKTGSFTGSELSVDGEITITHNLGISQVFLSLYDKDNKLIPSQNYDVDTQGNVNSFILTLYIPVGSTDVVNYRIL